MSASPGSWVRMWEALGAQSIDEKLYAGLMANWREPHRRYHTPQHLGECLAHFKAVRRWTRRPAEIELALWFHDAYYDPTRSDNELRSADWARASVLDAGIAVDVADRVHALIMATCDHQPCNDSDTQWLLDIDLSILGAEPARFDESDAQIREEYAHVPDGEFRQGRRRILSGFLARPRLYGTDYFHAALEDRARANLRRSLARLSA